jgi:hypothetical protein
MTGEQRTSRNAERRNRGIIRGTGIRLDSLRKKKQENIMINCVPAGTGRGHLQALLIWQIFSAPKAILPFS